MTNYQLYYGIKCIEHIVVDMAILGFTMLFIYLYAKEQRKR